jgi:hypothetical protein
MEQRIGVSRLTPIEPPEGEVSFEAEDDDDALAYVRKHFMRRLQECVRAELSSMAIVYDASGTHSRLIDDSLENPHFQEAYMRYNAKTQQLEVDFVSTATVLLPDGQKQSMI